jgi:hypothetical protein
MLNSVISKRSPFSLTVFFTPSTAVLQEIKYICLNFNADITYEWRPSQILVLSFFPAILFSVY